MGYFHRKKRSNTLAVTTVTKKEISRYGVMGFPAMVINRKVKAVGSVPSRSKIKELIREAETEIQQNKA